MDRNARLVSLIVAVLTLSVAAYLFWNPRGQPRSNISGEAPPNPPDSGTAALVDPSPAAEGDLLLPAMLADSDRESFAQHFARLRARGLVLTRDEFGDAREPNLFNVLMRLRPYWLSDTLNASVRVGGQLVGEIEMLRQVTVESTEFVRLEFSPTEPHWVVRVFLVGPVRR